MVFCCARWFRKRKVPIITGEGKRDHTFLSSHPATLLASHLHVNLFPLPPPILASKRRPVKPPCSEAKDHFIPVSSHSRAVALSTYFIFPFFNLLHENQHLFFDMSNDRAASPVNISSINCEDGDIDLAKVDELLLLPVAETPGKCT